MDMNGHDVLDDCAQDVPTLAQNFFGGFWGYSEVFFGGVTEFYATQNYTFTYTLITFCFE